MSQRDLKFYAIIIRCLYIDVTLKYAFLIIFVTAKHMTVHDVIVTIL